ncbi:hypothetical protein DN069_21430 [Streptacidiphilus pinicola]|uniref:Uncharacterized protein n=1 Tax=Streptacidiphilus pinicola TaxID=2219663 RepID=A0A2X0K8P6_9ACTN|nr:hypothetical protein DN069_21430 [Streptacidiphilus pinicola]
MYGGSVGHPGRTLGVGCWLVGMTGVSSLRRGFAGLGIRGGSWLTAGGPPRAHLPALLGFALDGFLGEAVELLL